METGGLLVLLAGRGVLCSLSADMLLHSQGSYLDLGCHHCRNPAGGKWLVPCACPFIHCEFMSQVFICLNLNGRFLLCPFCQRRTLTIGLDSAQNIRSIQQGKSLLVNRVA